MFSRKTFADMRRGGMGVGLSKAKLSEAMFDILLQLPTGTMSLKETIVRHLGLLGQMCATRDIEHAWNQTKKRAAKLYPERFILGDRNTLLWNDGTIEVLDKNISKANLKHLNALAESEHCTVNTMVARLIQCYQRTKA